MAKLPGSLEIWKFIDEPDLLVWILYQFWLLNLKCLASILKFGKISTIQIGWNYSQLNIRTKFWHVSRRTFLLYLNDSMMDLDLDGPMEITVLYLTTYFISKNIIKLSHFRWVLYTFLSHRSPFCCLITNFQFLKNGRRIQLKYSPK